MSASQGAKWMAIGQQVWCVSADGIESARFWGTEHGLPYVVFDDDDVARHWPERWTFDDSAAAVAAWRAVPDLFRDAASLIEMAEDRAEKGKR